MKLKCGDNYYVRTVTDYWVGRLVEVDGSYTVTLDSFSWVANCGRLGAFLRDGKTPDMEVEVAPPGMKKMVQWLSIDEWPHPLFTEDV